MRQDESRADRLRRLQALRQQGVEPEAALAEVGAAQEAQPSRAERLQAARAGRGEAKRKGLGLDLPFRSFAAGTALPRPTEAIPDGSPLPMPDYGPDPLGLKGAADAYSAASGGEIAQQLTGDVARGAAAGIGSLVDALDSIAAHFFGGSDLVMSPEELAQQEPVAAQLSRAVSDVIPPVSGLRDTLPSQVAEGVGSSAPLLGGGLVLRGASKVPRLLSMMGLGGMQAAAPAYREAIEGGATEEEAIKAFAATVVGSGSLELLPIERMLGRVNRASGGGLGRAILDMAVEGGAEGATEAAQAVFENEVARHIWDDEREALETAEILRQGLLGALTGSVLSGLVSGADAASRRLSGSQEATGPDVPSTLPEADSGPQAPSDEPQRFASAPGTPERLDNAPPPESLTLPGTTEPAAVQAQPEVATAQGAEAAPPTDPPASEPVVEEPGRPDFEDGLAPETRAQYFERKFVEQFNAPRRQQAAFEQAEGRPAKESEDVVQAEILYKGRAQDQQDIVERELVQPLMDTAGEAGISMDEIVEYAIARHAQTRNAVIRERNELNDAGSGMTDAEAQTVLDRVAQDERAPAFERVGEQLSRLVEKQRSVLIESGLSTEEEMQVWREQFGDTYVPLQDIIEGESPFSRGSGYQVRGKESARAKGRGEGNLADNPVASLVAQTQNAIVRAEKNRVTETMAQQIEAHPNENWATIDEKPPERHSERVEWDARTITWKRDGKEHTITFKDPGKSGDPSLMARAFRQMSPEGVGLLVKTVGPITRMYSQMLTSWDPDFVVRNLFKDVETAAFNLGAEEGRKAAVEIVKPANVFRAAKAFRDVGRDLRAEGDWQDIVRRYRAAGAKVAWVEPSDPATTVKRLERMLSDVNPTRPRSVVLAFKAMGDWIADWNSAAENAVRVSAFKWAVEKGGMSDAKAARMAKELTVNFNAKGEVGPEMNVAYMFYNASTQSLRRSAKMARTKRGKAILAGLFAAGAAEAYANYLLAGEDEDGVNLTEKVPEWVKARRWMFWIPGTDRAASIPMPYVYNVPYEMGRRAVNVALGVEQADEAAMATIASVAESVSPIGSEASALQLMSPTLVDPVVQMMTNETFFGSPIRPQRYNPDTPNSQLYWNSSEGTAVQRATTALNELSGGSTELGGVIDVSPEDVEHWMQFLAGGVGRTSGRVVDSVGSMFRGEMPPLHKIPFVRNFVLEVDQEKWRRGTFFEQTRLAEQYVRHVKALRDRGDGAQADAFEKRHAAILSMAEEARTARIMRNRIRKSGSLSEDEKATRMAEIEDDFIYQLVQSDGFQRRDALAGGF